MTSPREAAVERFFGGLPFAPDAYQQDAIAAIARGASVVVTAPTGAGKTLIAEAAIAIALSEGKRAFYTAPIKALSNQKYADFSGEHGPDQVGLLTGDNVINGEAPIVVMTTEVLRNMIYDRASALETVGVVVLDEVHYLQDRFRGSVWEEIIIHLPQRIPLVNLSATIANAEEFTEWIRARRGTTELVVETHRPVPLESLYLVKDRFQGNRCDLFPVFSGEQPNQQVVRLLRKGRGRRRRFSGPRRLEVAEVLQGEGLLPAIYFIFSRAGCDQAARTVAEARLDLVPEAERREIRRRAELLTDHLDPVDLAVLGYSSWAYNLEQGVAAHHAGMVPAFKETVEDLFAEGLLRLVFATETLALGINMPARTVVIERLSKFTGDAHELLQPGDYTQLTGRAGRRGIDRFGTAVVLHNYDVPFERVAAIAGQGSHPLRSSFQPNYNMAVNLIANYDRTRAEELLSASFAQFRAERQRTDLEARLGERNADVAEFRKAAACDRGDIWDFARRRGSSATSRVRAMRDFVQQTRAGDVLQLTAEPGDRWVLLARGWNGSPRLLLLAPNGKTRRMRPDQLPATLAILGYLDLPEPIRSRDSGYGSGVARLLREWEPDPDVAPVRFDQGTTDTDPVASCPQLSEHLSWVRRVQRGEREITRLQRRLGASSAVLVEQFHALLQLLDEWGYVREWSLTPKGERLRFVYNELDLLLVETMSTGAGEGLIPADLAAFMSSFTYESRLRDEPGVVPNRAVERRVQALEELSADLSSDEQRLRIPTTRAPDAGFATLAHAWAAGGNLDDLFDEDAMAGDFVRNCRQLLDVLRQIRDGFPEFAAVAQEAIVSVDRGVVAAGGRT